jgi:PleD family two-component response regulator
MTSVCATSAADPAAVIPAAILIVDDEPFNRKLLETMLHPEGYATASVASGEVPVWLPTGQL